MGFLESPSYKRTSQKLSSCQRMASADKHCGVRRFSLILAIFALVGSLLSLIPEPFDGLPIVCQLILFGPWYAILGVVSGALGLFLRSRIAPIAALLCVFITIAIYVVPFLNNNSHLSDISIQQEQSNNQSLKVMTLNTHIGQADAQQIVDAVRTNAVQILCLQEATPDLLEALAQAGVVDLLPYYIGTAPGDMILCNIEPIDPCDDAIGYSGASMAAATFVLGDSYLRFVSVHTCSPTPGYEQLWNESLSLVQAAGSHDPDYTEQTNYVLAGDFNATIGHASFRALLDCGYTDAALQVGQIYYPTWPDVLHGCAFAAIDHVLMPGCVYASDLSYLSIANTDHKAIIMTLTAVSPS